VQAAGDGVPAAAELAAGVQDGHHHLDRGPTLGGVHRHRDAATVVLHLHPTVGQQGDLDVVAVAGQRLVHGVVHHLVDQVVQAPFTGGTDVHAGALANCFKPLENGDVAGVIASRPGW